MDGMTRTTGRPNSPVRAGYLGLITPKDCEGRKIIPKRTDQPTAIPLTTGFITNDENSSTTKFFVNPGTELTIKAPVTGEYKSNGQFDHRFKLFYTHYAVQGKFTNSSGQEQETELIIPRKIVEERFQFA